MAHLLISGAVLLRQYICRQTRDASTNYPVLAIKEEVFGH